MRVYKDLPHQAAAALAIRGPFVETLEGLRILLCRA